jgi:hypothetical protein
VWYSKVYCTVLFNGIVRYSALENGILRNDEVLYGLERFSERKYGSYEIVSSHMIRHRDSVV